MVEIQSRNDKVFCRVWVDEQTHIGFVAKMAAMQRTGVHAMLSIYINDDLLGYGRLNVDSAEQRTRLVNRAHGQMSPTMRELYPAPRMQHDADLFCSGLWNAHTSQFTGQLYPGDPSYRPRYYASPLVLEGGGTIVYAPGGSGKSLLAMTLACSIEYGIESIWAEIHSLPILYVNLERDIRLMQSRLAQINRCLGADEYTALRFLHARGKSLLDVHAGIERTVERDGIGVVVVDSISRTGIGDLNDNQSANTIIDILNGMCPTWLAIAHTSKSDRDQIFGSVHFSNGADITIRLTHQERNGLLGMRLKQTKTNDVGKSPDQWLAYEFDGHRLTGIRRSSREEFPDLDRGPRHRSAHEDVAGHLSEHPRSTVKQIGEALSLPESTVRKVLYSDPNRFAKAPGDKRPVEWALNGADS